MIDASTLWDLVELRAEATPDDLFAVDDRDRRMSFADYRAAAERTAAALFALGVESGVPVAWQLPTTLESMVLCAALSRLDAVQVPILPIYRKREVGFAVAQTGAALLFVPGLWRGFDHTALAREVIGEGRVVVVAGALPEADPASLPASDRSAENVRWILYTSGTTSDPKGARHSDAGLLAASRGFCDALRLRPDDRVAMVFPFTHVGGVLWLMNGLRVGCAHIVIPTFGADSIAVLARHSVTQAGAGTVFHQAYLAAQRAAGSDPLFPRVRTFPGGGAPKPPQLHYDLKREMGGAGIVAGYGMTECPVLAMSSPDDPDEKLAHAEGRASPRGEMQIRVVKLDGTPAGVGEEGEFRVKGPQLCHGYLDATLDDDAFDDDGFFRTGDLGHLDEGGWLYVTGRLKDVIIRKGENISAKEIEELLFEHPKVEDTAVIGLPDPKSGEIVCAVLVCANAADPLGFDEMNDYLRGRGLMVQKLPERLELADELPRNPTGKVLKHELRRRFS